MERIDHGGLKLPGRDTALKHDVQLSISPALGLGKAEKGPDETAGAETGPEEAGLASPVPGGGVEHVGEDDAVDDAEDVVEVAGEDDGLDAETGGREFGHERVADGADGGVVEEGVDQ